MFAEQQNSSRTKSAVIRAQGCSRWRILIGRGKRPKTRRRNSYQIPPNQHLGLEHHRQSEVLMREVFGFSGLFGFVCFVFAGGRGGGSFQSLQPKVLLATWLPSLRTFFFYIYSLTTMKQSKTHCHTIVPQEA